MTRVTIRFIGEGADQVHGVEIVRCHRIGRFCEEARDHGGLLTQEDLAQIFNCGGGAASRAGRC